MYRYLLAQLFSKISLINRSAAIQTAVAIALATVLSGCGDKGDLYLPEDTATTYQASPEQSQN